MARRTVVLLALALLLCAQGCVTHVHRVGLGPVQGTELARERQYYILFGLFRLNDVDTHQIAKGRNSYQVETTTSFWDLVLTPFLFPLSVTSRTVTVTQ